MGYWDYWCPNFRRSVGYYCASFILGLFRLVIRFLFFGIIRFAMDYLDYSDYFRLFRIIFFSLDYTDYCKCLQ